MASSTCSIKQPVSRFRHCDTPPSDKSKPWLWDESFHLISPLAITDAHVKTHDASDVHLIVAVMSSNKNSITISMWKKQVTARRQGKHEGPTTLYILWAILQAVTHLVAVVVIGIFALQMMVSARDCYLVTLLTGGGLKNGNRIISLTWRSTKYMGAWNVREWSRM